MRLSQVGTKHEVITCRHWLAFYFELWFKASMHMIEGLANPHIGTRFNSTNKVGMVHELVLVLVNRIW